MAEVDDELWADQLMTTEMFNRAVANAHVRSYFERAMRIVPAPHHYDECLLEPDELYGLDYILPGDVPDTEAGRLLSRKVQGQLDDVQNALEELHRVGRYVMRNTPLDAQQAVE